MANRKTTRRRNGLFDFARKVRARSAKGYMVLDSDNYPVHTGRNLTKREALQIARDARKDGERVHLARFKENPPKIKRAPSRSGWMKATAVKFVTRNGKRVVLVRKPGTKRRKR